MSTLGKVNKALKEAADSERGTKETEGTEKDADAKNAENSKIGENTENADEEKDNEKRAEVISVDVRI